MVKAGTLNFSATGNVAVTGVGFTPQLVMFLDITSTGSNAMNMFGAMDYNGNEFCVSHTSRGGQANQDLKTLWSTTTCIANLRHWHSSQNTDYACSFVSMDTDGFTVNCSNAPQSSTTIAYLALAGFDDVYVGTATSGSGTQSFTGVGFTPDAYMIGVAEAGDRLWASYGFSDGTNRGSCGYTGNQNSAQHKGAERVQTDEVIATAYYDTPRDEADHSSMDADGFSIAWGGDRSGEEMWFICFKGGDYYVGSDSMQGSTGNWSTTGVGFKPEVGIAICTERSAVGYNNENHLWIGFTDGTNQYGQGMTNEVDETGNSDCDHMSSSTSWIQNYNYAQSSIGEARFVSFDADGMTNNQIDVDNTLFVFFLFRPRIRRSNVSST
jgi:hypothetical protein